MHKLIVCCKMIQFAYRNLIGHDIFSFLLPRRSSSVVIALSPYIDVCNCKWSSTNYAWGLTRDRALKSPFPVLPTDDVFGGLVTLTSFHVALMLISWFILRQLSITLIYNASLALPLYLFSYSVILLLCH